MSIQHILLIDDDEDDQEIFLTALNEVSLSVKCTTLNNAKKALHELISKNVVPDIIFLDLNMPIMNGQQFLEEIKKEPTLRHIPIIILSTSSHPGTIEQTKKLGAFNFITKPDKFNELVTVLQALMN